MLVHSETLHWNYSRLTRKDHLYDQSSKFGISPMIYIGNILCIGIEVRTTINGPSECQLHVQLIERSPFRSNRMQKSGNCRTSSKAFLCKHCYRRNGLSKWPRSWDVKSFTMAQKQYHTIRHFVPQLESHLPQDGIKHAIPLRPRKVKPNLKLSSRISAALI